MMSRTDTGTETTERVAGRTGSLATIVVAAAVVVMFTALWIGELISLQDTLRMPHRGSAAAELIASASAYR
jgi:hypothetical protein